MGSDFLKDLVRQVQRDEMERARQGAETGADQTTPSGQGAFAEAEAESTEKQRAQEVGDPGDNEFGAPPKQPSPLEGPAAAISPARVPAADRKAYVPPGIPAPTGTAKPYEIREPSAVEKGWCEKLTGSEAPVGITVPTAEEGEMAAKLSRFEAETDMWKAAAINLAQGGRRGGKGGRLPSTAVGEAGGHELMGDELLRKYTDVLDPERRDIVIYEVATAGAKDALKALTGPQPGSSAYTGGLTREERDRGLGLARPDRHWGSPSERTGGQDTQYRRQMVASLKRGDLEGPNTDPQVRALAEQWLVEDEGEMGLMWLNLYPRELTESRTAQATQPAREALRIAARLRTGGQAGEAARRALGRHEVTSTGPLGFVPPDRQSTGSTGLETMRASESRYRFPDDQEDPTDPLVMRHDRLVEALLAGKLPEGSEAREKAIRIVAERRFAQPPRSMVDRYSSLRKSPWEWHPDAYERWLEAREQGARVRLDEQSIQPIQRVLKAGYDKLTDQRKQDDSLLESFRAGKILEEKGEAIIDQEYWRWLQKEALAIMARRESETEGGD